MSGMVHGALIERGVLMIITGVHFLHALPWFSNTRPGLGMHGVLIKDDLISG